MTTPRVTVPVEPTPEMIAAACGEGDQHPLLKYLTPEERSGKAIFPLAIYRAMISAAPAPEGGAVSIWSDARSLFVRYAELFALTERYEEASAIADKAAREIEALAALQAEQKGGA